VKQTVYRELLDIRSRRGAGFIVLLDPDKCDISEAAGKMTVFEAAGVDAIFIGGSLMHASEVDDFVASLQTETSLPLIGFPGSISQISPHLSAVLFLSVISGRNPDMLIGQHVHAAPMIRRFGLESISTGYMLVESGRLTTAHYMNQSLPLPRSRPQVAAATALAADMIGMRLLYADAGSGADEPVPAEMIRAITSVCSAPLIVGGGLTEPQNITIAVESGASFIVVGTALEKCDDPEYLEELVQAAHVAEAQRI
jgi:phosphoglycerol geranylgeranyltransferase